MGNWWLEVRKLVESMKSDQEPKPGDLIQIFRGVYSHWAVYVGDGDVVHLTAPSGVSNTFTSVLTKKGLVRKQKLKEVVGDNKWIINNLLDMVFEPRSADDIVKEALMEVGKMIKYNLISNNCGHFATELRYGKAVSIQVIMAAGLLYLCGSTIIWVVSLLTLIAGLIDNIPSCLKLFSRYTPYLL